MPNRLQSRIQKTQKARTKLFCAFLTLGYPNLQTTEKLIQKFEEEGVDIIELGFPFSDPLADGPTIQFSSERALAKGVRIEDAFKLVADLRRKGSRVPIIFFTYLNPIFHFGLKRFVKEAKAAGFDGVLVPDLPLEEEREFQSECWRQNLLQVFLVAPTTEKKRAIRIAQRSQGFIYFVSLRGVTGARESLSADVRNGIHVLRRASKKPVLIGFGVSSPEQARELSKLSQGVIVGSAIIDHLRKDRGRIDPTVRFVREMVRQVKGRT